MANEPKELTEDEKYRGGNIWEAPSGLRAMISISGGNREVKMFLISDPSEHGSYASTDENGKWLYTLEELKARLANWTWIGTFEQLCKEALSNKEVA